MLKKIGVSVLALAVAGMSGSAMAACPVDHQIDGQNYCVDVNINVLPVVSIWGFEDSVLITMNSADGNNTAYHESSFQYINNVDAVLSVTVTSAGAWDPAINFFVADNGDGEAVRVAMLSNAYAPVGVGTVVRWTSAESGVEKPFIDLPTNLGGPTPTHDFTYLANSPGPIADDGLNNLEVLWTIAPDI